MTRSNDAIKTFFPSPKHFSKPVRRHEQVNQQEGEGAEKSHKLFFATNQSSIRAGEFKFPPDMAHVNATSLLLNRYLAAEILI